MRFILEAKFFGDALFGHFLILCLIHSYQVGTKDLQIPNKNKVSLYLQLTCGLVSDLYHWTLSAYYVVRHKDNYVKVDEKYPHFKLGHSGVYLDEKYPELLYKL